MEVIIIKNEKVEVSEVMVESSSQPGAYYRVNGNNGVWECTCPDFAKRGAQRPCKHIISAKNEIR